MMDVVTQRRRGWLLSFGGLMAGALLSAPAARAQQTVPFGLEFSNRLRVVAGTDTLVNPWAGGINTPAVSKMDFDRDGTPDLLVWDGRVQRPLTFVARAGRWEYAPAYEAALPALDSGYVTYFARLRDYDGDGLPDLFLNAGPYIRLYRQELTSGTPGFRFVRVSAPYLQTEPAPQPQPLTEFLTAPWTTWDLADIDADGDLDLVAYEYLGSRILLHRNQAGPGALPVFREDRAWGGISWCSAAQTYGFTASGTACRPGSPQHGGNPASTIALPDIDGDGDHDLLLGQEYLQDLALLRNLGTPTQEMFTDNSVESPMAATPAPVQVTHAPAAFYEDVTFDQQPDLVVSPWLVLPSPITIADVFDARRSAHLYAGGAGGFTLRQPDFLQDQMIDVGENAAPTLGDLDGDGDLDLLVGNLGEYVPNPTGQPTPLSYRAQLRFYRNVGTHTRAVFRLDDADFAGLSALDRRSLVPVLTDLDGNGTADLVLRSTANAVGAGSLPLSYVLNTAPAGQLAVYPLSTEQQFVFQIGAHRGNRDLPCFFDVDGDGRRDILLGTNQQINGASTVLHYLHNNGGTPASAFTLADVDFGRLPADLVAVDGWAPAVADIDGNGRPELLTLADDGELRVWPQLLTSSTTPTSDVHNLVRNDLTTVFGPSTLGRRSVLTTGDLDGDGRAEVLVGTAGGGVRLLRSQPNGLTARAPELTAAGYAAFPNPTAGQPLTVEWPTKAKSASLTLTNALGQPVRRLTARGGTAQLDVAGLPAGLYLLRVQPQGDAPRLLRVLLTPAAR